MKKKMLIIASLVMVLAFSFVVFSYTMDELKSVFLTRDEFDVWAHKDCSIPDATNNSGNPIGMSEYLESYVERNRFMSIYDEAGYQMYRRDIFSNASIESIKQDSEHGGPETLARWSSRRAKELEDMTRTSSPVTFGAPSPTIAPAETASPSDAS